MLRHTLMGMAYRVRFAENRQAAMTAAGAANTWLRRHLGSALHTTGAARIRADAVSKENLRCRNRQRRLVTYTRIFSVSGTETSRR